MEAGCKRGSRTPSTCLSLLPLLPLFALTPLLCAGGSVNTDCNRPGGNGVGIAPLVNYTFGCDNSSEVMTGYTFLRCNGGASFSLQAKCRPLLASSATPAPSLASPQPPATAVTPPAMCRLLRGTCKGTNPLISYTDNDNAAAPTQTQVVRTFAYGCPEGAALQTITPRACPGDAGKPATYDSDVVCCATSAALPAVPSVAAPEPTAAPSVPAPSTQKLVRLFRTQCSDEPVDGIAEVLELFRPICPQWYALSTVTLYSGGCWDGSVGASQYFMVYRCVLNVKAAITDTTFLTEPVTEKPEADGSKDGAGASGSGDAAAEGETDDADDSTSRFERGDRAATNTLIAVAVGSILQLSATSLGGLGILVLLSSLDCTRPSRSFIAASNQTAPVPPWQVYPLGIPLGTTYHRYYVGCVVVNGLLMGAAFALLFALRCMRYVRGCSGLVVMPAALLMPGTAAAASRLALFYADAPLHTGLFGVATLVGCMLSPFFLWKHVLQSDVFEAVSVQDQKATSPVFVFFYGDEFWASPSSSSRFTDAYRTCFEPFREGRHTFYVYELLLVVVVALLSVWRATVESTLPCHIRDGAISFLVGVFWMALVWARPYASCFSNLAAVVQYALLLAACIVRSVAPRDADHADADSAEDDAASILFATAAYYLMTKTMADLVMFFIEGRRRRTRSTLAIADLDSLDDTHYSARSTHSGQPLTPHKRPGGGGGGGYPPTPAAKGFADNSYSPHSPHTPGSFRTSGAVASFRGGVAAGLMGRASGSPELRPGSSVASASSMRQTDTMTGTAEAAAAEAEAAVAAFEAGHRRQRYVEEEVEEVEEDEDEEEEEDCDRRVTASTLEQSATATVESSPPQPAQASPAKPALSVETTFLKASTSFTMSSPLPDARKSCTSVGGGRDGDGEGESGVTMITSPMGAAGRISLLDRTAVSGSPVHLLTPLSVASRTHHRLSPFDTNLCGRSSSTMSALFSAATAGGGGDLSRARTFSGRCTESVSSLRHPLLSPSSASRLISPTTPCSSHSSPTTQASRVDFKLPL